MLLSIIQGIFNKKSDTALNELVLKAKSGDKKVMNDLLIAFTPFIKKQLLPYVNDSWMSMTTNSVLL